jgi:ATP-dependent Lon protease
LSENGWSHVVVTEKMIRKFLKKERFESERSETIDMPGIATGLAVTSVGGDILYIEATKMPGKGRLSMTGQLGNVMKESAQIAFSYVRAKAEPLGIAPEAIRQRGCTRACPGRRTAQRRSFGGCRHGHHTGQFVQRQTRSQ